MNPWDDADVAQAQRKLVDAQLAKAVIGNPLAAFAHAVRLTKSTGSLLEIGCASGYGCEVLDRCGVAYASYTGMDVSGPAIAMATERYPGCSWIQGLFPGEASAHLRADLVIDAGCMLCVDDWRVHLSALCAAAKTWLILHRVPRSVRTVRRASGGYGKQWDTWVFDPGELVHEVGYRSFETVDSIVADTGDQSTITCRRVVQP